MLVLVVVLVVVAWRSSRPVDVVVLEGWSHSMVGVGVGKPTLMLFTADWCPPCQVLKSEVLKDPVIAARLSREFRLVKMDVTERDREVDQWANRFGVTGLPTLVMLDGSDRRVSELVGLVGGEEFLDWLDRGLEHVAVGGAAMAGE